MLRETERIAVLNYNENSVSVRTSPAESVKFERSLDGVNPTTVALTIDQIRYANNHNVFRNGFLFFDKAKEKDVYEMLGIINWEDILTNQDIKEILIHPTFEGLTKIISIKDDAVFERVRAAYHKIKVENIYDVSVRVAQIVETRYRELQNKKINTSIVLEKRDVTSLVDNEEVEKLKSANSDLQKQIEEMKAMMEQLMKDKTETTSKNSKTSSKTKKSE